MKILISLAREGEKIRNRQAPEWCNFVSAGPVRHEKKKQAKGHEAALVLLCP
ncbi:MAG: hypothetical protein HY885_07300 [Deltaproteobacteria bacterium]|nr:hypothetical protein [Deltaproteobacteria bacterium]